jgi:hypothetical protein
MATHNHEVDEVSEEGTLGAASLAHKAFGKYYFPILQQVLPFE